MRAATTSIALAVFAASSSAQEGLRTYTTREARIKSNAPAAVSKAVGERIDNYCAIFEDFYAGLKIPRKNDNKIVARMFATYGEFAEYCSRNTSFPDVPAAFFSPDMNAIVLYDDESDIYLRQTLFHECSHQFLNRHTYSAPKWLNEGLAEYFEGWRLSPEGKLLEKRPSLFDLRILQESIHTANRLPLRELVDMPTEKFVDFAKLHPDLDPYLHYATAWGFVYASLEGGNAEDRARFLRCLEDLNKKQDSDAYAKVDWNAIEERFEKTIANLKSEPRDASDHVLLARGEVRSRAFPAAIAHYEEARRLDPKMPGLAYWIGYLCQRNGEYEKAREELEVARKEDPKAPMPCYQLARIAFGFDAQGQEPDFAKGLALAQEASKLAGKDDPFYLMFLAECQAYAGEKTKAVVTARKAVQLADDEDRAAYQQRLERLQRGK